jgi:hypothetical protein
MFARDGPLGVLENVSGHSAATLRNLPAQASVEQI